MAVLDLQRRSQQIGRIRLGQQVKTDKGGMRPDRLTTFRFTTASKMTATAIAELYGGEVRPWEGQYEVITGKSEIGVTVPPRDAVISQWYEMWNKGGCIRRCDSQHERISNGPCQCPQPGDPDDPESVAANARERARLSKLNPPRACGLITRINVMIPDLPGLGVFRLDTGSFYAAGESGDKADIMELARAHNVFLPAMLRIEWRKRIAGGKTTPYPVPVLEILDTFRDIASGALEARGILGQLPPAPGEQRRAITTGVQVSAPTPDPAPDKPDFDRMSPQQQAQSIANAAAEATARTQIEQLDEMSEAHNVGDHQVCTDVKEDVWEELRSHLRDRWRELPAAGAA
jgi:hypothetical protein